MDLPDPLPMPSPLQENRMGTFYAPCRVRNLATPDRFVEVPYLLVDTGSECTWLPRAALESIGLEESVKTRTFAMADGRVITRPVVYAEIVVGQERTCDEIVVAEPGELQLLGARTLEGLGLRVDPVRKILIPAGPAPAAAAA